MPIKNQNNPGAIPLDGETGKPLISISPDAVFIHDGESILYCNPAAVSMYRANDIDDLIGMHPNDLVHPDDLDWLRRRRKQTSTLGATAPLEATRRIRLDGTVFYAENTSVGVEYNGNPAYMILSRDVTDRKLLEESLRENEEQYRRVFEDSGVGMAANELDGRFIRVNKAFCTMLGYSEEELLTKTVFDITYHEDVPMTLVARKRIVEDDRKIDTLEKRYVCKDGKLIWGLLNRSLVNDGNGQPQPCHLA